MSRRIWGYEGRTPEERMRESLKRSQDEMFRRITGLSADDVRAWGDTQRSGGMKNVTPKNPPGQPALGPAQTLEKETP